MTSIILNNKKLRSSLIAVFISILTYFFLPESLPEAARRMSGIFVFSALFWAFEIIPIWVTAIVVLLLEIFLLALPGGPIGFDANGYAEFFLPFRSPVLRLFFGGFVLAIAMSKCHLDQMIASKLLRFCGTKPIAVLAGFMGVSAFLSMWMSNTATAAMMLVMTRPLLNQIPGTDPFRKSLALSIAVGANLGGIGTPVGTPPNAIVLGFLSEKGIQIDFLSWMIMALPLVIISMILALGLLMWLYPPNIHDVRLTIHHEVVSGWKVKATGLIASLTVILWLTSGLTGYPISVVALLGATLFFVFDLLDKEDLKRLDWDIIILIAGGLSLGKGMQISGLTDIIVSSSVFQSEGFMLLFAFCALGLLFSTFISNTATANLLIPMAIGVSSGNSVFLAIAVSLSCSYAMALPISTPPNAIAYASKTFTTKDLVKVGGLISVLGMVFVLVFGRVLFGLIYPS